MSRRLATPARSRAAPWSRPRCAAPMARFTRWRKAMWWSAAPAPRPAGAKSRSTTLAPGALRPAPQGGRAEEGGRRRINEGKSIRLQLNSMDFQTARRVAQAINATLGQGLATALDGRTVQVQ